MVRSIAADAPPPLWLIAILAAAERHGVAVLLMMLFGVAGALTAANVARSMQVKGGLRDAVQ